MDLYENGKERRHDNGYGVFEDRLSNLPDAILAYILSFLPIKKSVSTSILSKRWISLWTFVPNLSICVGDVGLPERKASDSVGFVDKILIGHKMPFLEEIDIDCLSFDQSSLDSWISAVVEHDVRTLNLTSVHYDETPCILPSSLFTMSKIVSLQLEYCVVLRFPSVLPCFPNLKKLILRFLAYEDDESVQNLISSCPVLEELLLHRQHEDGLKTLNVISQSLKRLSLFLNLFRPQLDYIPTTVIDCPAAQYIHIEDSEAETFIVKDLSSLVHARLDLSSLYYEFDELGTSASHIFELLAAFSNVKALSISESTISAISAADGWILPTFHNLKHLEFFTLEHDLWNMTAIIEFLKSTPVLEVLIFEGSSFSGEEFNCYSVDVPNCLTSHLKTIEVDVYLGKNDVDVIRYFVENSNVLENVSVKRKGEKELEGLSSSSNSCRISFY